MKHIFLFLILFILTRSLSAQTEHSDNYSLGLTSGYTYTKSHFIQMGAIFGKDYGNVHNPSKGFGLGVEIGSVNNTLTIGTKAFYEYNFFIMSGFRLNAINYFSGQNTDFRLMPQIGISLFGYMNLMYGYSIPALGNELTYIRRHSFSVTLNFLQ